MEWEQRRLQNIEQMNEEMEKIAEYERSRRVSPEYGPVQTSINQSRRRFRKPAPVPSSQEDSDQWEDVSGDEEEEEEEEEEGPGDPPSASQFKPVSPWPRRPPPSTRGTTPGTSPGTTPGATSTRSRARPPCRRATAPCWPSTPPSSCWAWRGNGAVLWVTAAELRRTVNGVWFSHLALADLLSCLALPFVALPLATDHHWPLGAVACKLLPSLTVLAMFAGVLVLTAISADRCALVTRPVWCHNRRTPALASAACAGAWALAALLTAPSSSSAPCASTPSRPRPPASCPTARRGGTGAAPSWPRRRRGSSAASWCLSPSSRAANGRLLSRLRARGLGGSQRATGTVLVVVVSFFVCWLPYHVVGLVLAVGAPGGAAFRGAQAADPAAAGLAYINGCVNPVIYLVMGRGLGKVRRSWRALLKGGAQRRATSAAGDAREKRRAR
ncbi:hypothetical protein DUI87_00059 [Hirundo rustica rustica]|uniref:C5a anaphylatoxin chemotactic receptor 1 n=1 Tax=Hirundo rustica rustica TaxID=333673 RepID=A0A3M0LC46_HIRRU|nr:hypothetical protein DUI87_00059 [Hirundo rustica rustica]